RPRAPEPHRVLPRAAHRVRRPMQLPQARRLRSSDGSPRAPAIPTTIRNRNHGSTIPRNIVLISLDFTYRSGLIDEGSVRIAKLFGLSSAAVLASTCCAFKSKSLRGESG